MVFWCVWKAQAIRKWAFVPTKKTLIGCYICLRRVVGERSCGGRELERGRGVSGVAIRLQMFFCGSDRTSELQQQTETVCSLFAWEEESKRGFSQIELGLPKSVGSFVSWKFCGTCVLKECWKFYG